MTQYLFVLTILALTHVCGHCVPYMDIISIYETCVSQCTEKKCDKGNALYCTMLII